jgi:cellulose synthase/poly-beta-1,6-N-acetylglucosamine synthase-like glycosyltransferase
MLTAPEPAYWPAVCFQVPAYNEPPELLAEIIKQLMRQDYPGRWMIQVIDNNTPDPRTWLPIRDLCKLLSDRVQFMHLENWPGYKAGALNEGTRRLPSWVELIAVIDADYLVDPHFLRATARHFADPQVAFVQTPQHYREWQGAPYFEGLFRMYESFFATFMTSRRENNGIIFAGTMGLVRRSALEEVGLWDAESITEDAELSVRLLGRGWYGIYDHRCYGGGLMPFDFGSLKRQRFRWAFGTIHLLKKHWRPLLGLRSREGYHLSLRQRLCFFGLGLQYFIEVVSFMFALLLLINVLAPFAGWNVSLPVFKAAMIVPLLLTTSGFVRTIWALREATRCKLSQAVGAFIFFFALSWVTARACVSALFRRRGVFLRTPKVREGQKWQSALRMTTQEIFLAASFICVALFTCYQHRVSTFSLMLLGLQAFIYGSAALCALAAEGIWLLPTWLLGTTGGAETALADGIMTEASQIYAAAQAPHLQLSRRIFTSQLHEAAKQDAEDVRSRLTRKRERMALRQYRRLYGRKFVTELHGF